METVETKETMEVKQKRKISIPFLVAGVLIFISSVLYSLYFINVLPSAIEYKMIDWNFSVTVIDFLVTLALAVFTIIAAFNTDKIKYLAILVFLGAAVTLYTLISTIMEYGIAVDDSFFIFRNITLVLAYILFGIYTIRKSFAIVFATIFITITSTFALWYNIEELIILIKASTPFGYMYAYLLLSLLALGSMVLIWSCCAMLPPISDGKHILKKNIVLSIALSIITLGVYTVFWVKSISEDIAKLETEKVNSSLETAMFFIVPFYAVYWLYTKGKKIAKIANDADMSILYAVQGLFLLCFFSLALMQNQLHMAVGLSKDN